jgi:pre-mRNA-splicing factor 38B
MKVLLFAGGSQMPSTGFCLLLRLLILRCSANQVTLLLEHRDSPYIRAIGFLYLRYACDPSHVFKWIEPFLYDDEPIQVRASRKGAAGGRGGSSNGTDSTIGEFVRSLFSSTSRDYYGSILPRLPIEIEREIQVKLLQAEKVQKRAETHLRNRFTMDYFQKLGSRVMATYEDEENPLQWYTAVVDRVILRDDNGPLKFPKFIVTFTEYGNTETVTLGEMDLPDGSFHREDQGYGQRGKGLADQRREGGRHHDLYEEVRRRERDTVTASGRGEYSRPPPTTKRSLAAAGHTKRSPELDSRKQSTHPSSLRRTSPKHETKNASSSNDDSCSQPPAAARKRTAEELAKIEEKKRKLLAKYG